MKVVLEGPLDLLRDLRQHGVLAYVASEPPRLSSQFADQAIFVFSPVSRDFGRATGVCSCAGASVSVA